MIAVEDLEHLGSALKMLRVASGQQQKAISKSTGMSNSQISRYERGRDMPNLVTVTRFLATVNADFTDLQDAIVAARDNRPWIRGASRTDAYLVSLIRPVICEIIQDEIGKANADESIDPRQD